MADERVAAGEDGDAGAAVQANVVVLDDAAPVVAHEHAHAAPVGDGVVQDVPARVDALDHDAVADVARDLRLLDQDDGACRASGDRVGGWAVEKGGW